jgi:capsular polysaccharide export protein
LHIFDGIKWLRSFFRKKLYYIKEQKIYSRLTKELSGRFFLVPLQVNNDAQIHQHSRFHSNQEFIKEVMLSFCAHAPQDSCLVIKQHPLDRGYNNYGPLIRDLADSLGILERTFYIHDFCLPTLLGCSIGVVVINSTVGLSALHHKKPLIALGDAIYSRPELTFQGTLNEFWKNAKYTSGKFYEVFLSHIIQTTQINGNFYRRLPVAGYRSGLIWS